MANSEPFSTHPSPSAKPLTHRQIQAVLGALMLGMLLAALDQTIVATALPTIVGELGGLEHLSWVVTAYMLASTVSTPLYGKLGDLLGRKVVFQIAIVIFLLGSVLSGLSRSMLELIAFRALQGLGGGGLMVTAQAAIADVVSPRERGRYQGYFGAVFGGASIVGPLLGGFFTDHLSWRWVFYVNVPVAVAAIAVTSAVLPGHEPTHRRSIDYPGLALLSSAVTALVLVATWGGARYPWASPVMIGLVAGAAGLFAAFFAAERRAKEPLLPLSLLRDRTFVVSSSTSFIVGFGMFGVVSFLPLFLQVARGASPTASGLLLLPLMAGMLTASITSGRVISRTGRYKRFPVIGTAVATLGMFLLSRLSPTTPRALATLFMAVTGLGLGMVMQVMIVATQNSVPRAHLGVATSMVSFARSVGGSFGVAVFGAIFNARLAAELGRSLPPGTPLTGEGASGVAALAHLEGPARSLFIGAFARALSTTFLCAVPCLALAFFLALSLEEKPLRGPEAASVPISE